jgi:tetratricopeptide (TPR) repeat protein
VLDAKEYLHLAINAMARDEHHAALNYIKEVLVLEPHNASALYLLGAEHAELGLYDRAIEEIEQALRIDPNIEMARFQLGLLYLKAGQMDGAIQAFSHLAAHGQTDSLRAYAAGLVALCNDDVAVARERLALGLSGDNNNPALKKDMQELLNKLLGGEAVMSQEESSAAPASASIYLGAYGAKS